MKIKPVLASRNLKLYKLVKRKLNDDRDLLTEYYTTVVSYAQVHMLHVNTLYLKGNDILPYWL